jgi:hypothetical protein
MTITDVTACPILTLDLGKYKRRPASSVPIGPATLRFAHP